VPAPSRRQAQARANFPPKELAARRRQNSQARTPALRDFATPFCVAKRNRRGAHLPVAPRRMKIARSFQRRVMADDDPSSNGTAEVQSNPWVALFALDEGVGNFRLRAWHEKSERNIPA